MPVAGPAQSSFGQAPRYAETRSDPGAGLEAETADVMVVSRSQINCVVVSRIVERSGLHPRSTPPDSARQSLADCRPSLVILDGGADNRDCEDLMGLLADCRRVSDRGLPRIILLSNRTGVPPGIVIGSPIDAVVAKPITPESLQPTVERLVGRDRS